jgi:serine-type D-Ala-D-Ala carboxypeptidase/endopeptidase (penicillin-binding protein 4)
MNHHTLAACALLLCCATAHAQDGGGTEAPELPDALTGDLDKILAHKRLAKARVGVCVVDLDSGDTVYTKNADETLNPASNIKLVTAAAVLDKHGTAFTFRTELRGKRKGKTVVDLYLRGNGDPFLHWDHLLEMAERLRRKGVTEVSGDLIVDDTAYDDGFTPPAFDQKKEQAPYRTTTGAVSASYSALTVIVVPGKPGAKPRVSFDPPNDYAIIENSATTVASKKEVGKNPLSVEVRAAKGRSRLIVSGKTWPGGGATVRKRVDAPTIYAGYLMKSALESLGITVKGEVRRGQPAGATTLLAGHSSLATPILVGLMQKYSNNFMAEMLFKSLDLGDKPATWAGATEAVQTFLDKAGLARDAYKLTNGSGLYDANKLSARQFTTVLAYMAGRHDLWPEYLSSFANAGVDGTLGRRMRGTPARGTARAKTGTLNGVSTLSGYVTSQSGRRFAYSVLFNKAPGGAWTYRQIQDKFVARLAAQ